LEIDGKKSLQLAAAGKSTAHANRLSIPMFYSVFFYEFRWFLYLAQL